MESSALSDKKVLAQAKLFVAVMAHSEDQHGTEEIQVGREKKTVCKLFKNITCDEHKACQRSAVSKFMKGNYGTPTTVFCNPKGEELSRRAGSMGASEFLKKMEESLGKVPGQKIHKDYWNLAKKYIEAGDKELEAGNYKKAISAYKKVVKMKQKPLQALGKEAMQKVAEKGDEMIEEAKELIDDGEKKAATKLLNKIKKAFRGTDASKEAAKLLKSIK